MSYADQALALALILVTIVVTGLILLGAVRLYSDMYYRTKSAGGSLGPGGEQRLLGPGGEQRLLGPGGEQRYY